MVYMLLYNKKLNKNILVNQVRNIFYINVYEKL